MGIFNDDEGFVRLNITELRALAALDPTKLLLWLHDSESHFIFGVEAFEPDQDLWGGEFRITLNRNIELHLVPDFNTAMLDASELPQYSVLPSENLAGTVKVRALAKHDDDDDEDPGQGLIFYVSPEEFKVFRDECQEIVDAWRADPFEDERVLSFPFLPESCFRDFDLMQWMLEKVLSHPVIHKARRYDGRLGYPTTPPKDDLDEEIPPPVITDDDDEVESLGNAYWPDMPELSAAILEEGFDYEDIEQQQMDERRRREGY